MAFLRQLSKFLLHVDLFAKIDTKSLRSALNSNDEEKLDAFFVAHFGDDKWDISDLIHTMKKECHDLIYPLTKQILVSPMLRNKFEMINTSLLGFFNEILIITRGFHFLRPKDECYLTDEQCDALGSTVFPDFTGSSAGEEISEEDFLTFIDDMSTLSNLFNDTRFAFAGTQLSNIRYNILSYLAEHPRIFLKFINSQYHLDHKVNALADLCRFYRMVDPQKKLAVPFIQLALQGNVFAELWDKEVPAWDQFKQRLCQQRLAWLCLEYGPLSVREKGKFYTALATLLLHRRKPEPITKLPVITKPAPQAKKKIRALKLNAENIKKALADDEMLDDLIASNYKHEDFFTTLYTKYQPYAGALLLRMLGTPALCHKYLLADAPDLLSGLHHWFFKWGDHAYLSKEQAELIRNAIFKGIYPLPPSGDGTWETFWKTFDGHLSLEEMIALNDNQPSQEEFMTLCSSLTSLAYLFEQIPPFIQDNLRGSHTIQYNILFYIAEHANIFMSLVHTFDDFSTLLNYCEKHAGEEGYDSIKTNLFDMALARYDFPAEEVAAKFARLYMQHYSPFNTSNITTKLTALYMKIVLCSAQAEKTSLLTANSLFTPDDALHAARAPMPSAPSIAPTQQKTSGAKK